MSKKYAIVKLYDNGEISNLDTKKICNTPEAAIKRFLKLRADMKEDELKLLSIGELISLLEKEAKLRKKSYSLVELTKLK